LGLVLTLLVALALAVSALADPPASAPIVRRGAALPTHSIAQGKGSAKILYDAGSGAPEAAMTLLVLEPGAAVPPHVHATSVEMLYLLDGAAGMQVGGEKLTLEAGDAARIPMGVEHSARVLGDRALRALQVYSPAGPEQRFIPKP
jgi:quercetin dioxygenase-like cupin family protein